MMTMPSIPHAKIARPGPEPVEIDLHVMQPVTLELEIDEHAGFFYPSIILDYEEGHSVAVGVPVRSGEEIRVCPGTNVSFSTTQSDGILTCRTHALAREAGFTPALIVAWPAGIKKIERREGLRVDTQIAVDLTYARNADSGPSVVQGVTTDLGQHGMKLMLPEPIADGTVLAVRMHLPGDHIRVCGGRVVRSGTTTLPGVGAMHWVGVEFQNVATALQHSLRRYLWDVQRDALRRPRV